MHASAPRLKYAHFSKHLVRALGFTILFFLKTSAFTSAPPSPAESPEWQAALRDAQYGRYAEASAGFEKISRSAIATNNLVEAARAILLKAQAEAAAANRRAQQPGALQMQIAAPGLPDTTKALLKFALANEWRRWFPAQNATVANAHALAEYRRAFAESSQHFKDALADPGLLQRTRLDTLAPLLTCEKNALAFANAIRPTLFDFIVFEALDFYNAGQTQKLLSTENAPDPAAAAGALLAPISEFLAWRSPEPRAVPAAASAPQSPDWTDVIALYQELLRFRRDDTGNRVALAEADLHRIMWAGNFLFRFRSAQPSATVELHQAALRTFIDTYRDTPTATTASVELARLCYLENPAAAHDVAVQGARLHPGAPAAAECRAIAAHLEEPDLLALATEHTWNAPWPDITAVCRNQPQIYFRAVPHDWEEFFKYKQGLFGTFSKKDLDKILAVKPAKAWSAKFPDAAAFEIHEEKISTASIAPALKPGFYFIVASLDESFSRDGNRIFCAPVWVSDLAIVHTPSDETVLRGYVVNALTGNPAPGVRVSGWLNSEPTAPDSTCVSDSDGAFTLIPSGASLGRVDRGYFDSYVLARAPDGAAIASGFALRPAPVSPFQVMQRHASIFTDRAVYHPGETIHYKIIASHMPEGALRAELLADFEIPLTLRTPESVALDAGTLRTSNYGSASGSFTLPGDAPEGVYYLATEFSKIMGSVMLNVVPRGASPPARDAPGATPFKTGPETRVSISASGLQTTSAPVLLKITTMRGDEAHPAEGVLEIHPMKQAPRPVSRALLVRFQNSPILADDDEREAQNTDAVVALAKRPLIRKQFSTDGKTGAAEIAARLPAGIYRAITTTRDSGGKTSSAHADIRVFNTRAKRPSFSEEITVAANSWELRPGETFTMIWATGAKNARACISFEQDGKTLARVWTARGATQQMFTLPITEAMRGGISLNIFQVSDNRFVTRQFDISVPHENQLSFAWERFGSELRAGTGERWIARILKPNAAPADAEVLAVLCDSAPDARYRHELPPAAVFSKQNYAGYAPRAATSTAVLFEHLPGALPQPAETDHPGQGYHSWNSAAANLPGRSTGKEEASAAGHDDAVKMPTYVVTAARYLVPKRPRVQNMFRIGFQADRNDPNHTAKIISLKKREAEHPPEGQTHFLSALNFPLQKTVFFHPTLHTGKKGKLELDFDVPGARAPSRWKLMIFAHDRKSNTVAISQDVTIVP